MYFTTTHQLDSLIDAYFTRIAGEFHFKNIPAKRSPTGKTTKQIVWDREPEPPTISGLVLFLGFESRAAFDKKERKGKYAQSLKRARLRIENEYEKKLHNPTASGAIFALKNLGWNERDIAAAGNNAPQSLNVNVNDSAIPTAGSEREVDV
jgi:hypothetical protein